jgi:hypothetical protein
MPVDIACVTVKSNYALTENATLLQLGRDACDAAAEAQLAHGDKKKQLLDLSQSLRERELDGWMSTKTHEKPNCDLLGASMAAMGIGNVHLLRGTELGMQLAREWYNRAEELCPTNDDAGVVQHRNNIKTNKMQLQLFEAECDGPYACNMATCAEDVTQQGNMIPVDACPVTITNYDDDNSIQQKRRESCVACKDCGHENYLAGSTQYKDWGAGCVRECSQLLCTAGMVWDWTTRLCSTCNNLNDLRLCNKRDTESMSLLESTITGNLPLLFLQIARLEVATYMIFRTVHACDVIKTSNRVHHSRFLLSVETVAASCANCARALRNRCMLMYRLGNGLMLHNKSSFIVKSQLAKDAMVLSGLGLRAVANSVAKSAQVLCAVLTSALCPAACRTKHAVSHFFLHFCQCLLRCKPIHFMLVLRSIC